MLTFFFKRVTGIPQSPYHERTVLFLETLAAFDEGAGSPENEFALDRLVRDLHGESNENYATFNIWNEFKAIYPYIGGTAFAHSLNLTDPSLFGITWYGSPTHNESGVSFDGVTQYGDSGIVDATYLQVKNKCAAFYFDNLVGAHQYAFGSYDGNLFAISLENIGYANISNVVGFNTVYTGTSLGVGKFVSVNVGATLGNLYSNGISVGSNISGNTAANDSIKIAGASTLRGKMRLKISMFSNGLSSDQQLFLYNSILNYQTALGRS